MTLLVPMVSAQARRAYLTSGDWSDPAFTAEVHAWLRKEAARLGIEVVGARPGGRAFRVKSSGEEPLKVRVL